MDYVILCNGKEIARFDTIIDRDDCFDFLSAKYEDCKFEARNDDE